MSIKREKCTKGLARDRTLALRPLTACVMLAFGHWAVANPTGPQVAAGSASIQASGKQLTVTNTPGTILNWQSFSIAPGELTRFMQQSAGSAVLNRVIAANPSAILGTLSSNGRVFLVNPHGIVVGAGALIDTAGFVGSTLNISDKDFLAGRLKFEGGGVGVLRNEGTIQAASDIFLVGPQIENAGIIRSAAGDVVLAAGKSVTITSPDAHGVQFGIQAPTDSVLNLGTIQAGNAVGLFAGTLKHSGEINVNTASLDSAGRVVLSAQKDAIVAGNATISVDNSVGKGGSVQVLGEHVGVFDQAAITARGASGGGEILIGGDFRGANPAVRNSFVTWFGPDAALDASATANGNGGKVIVWADDTTRAHGNIAARGGPLGGNGGLVETSGKRYLAATRTPDITAPRGAGGEWLLDPSSITFDATPGDANISGGDPFRPDDGGAVSRMDFAILKAAVEAGGGATVTVDTAAEANNGPGGGGNGDINFAVLASFSPTTAARLILNADGDILLPNGINKAGGGNLTLEFHPNRTSGTAGTRITGITSNGNLTLDGNFAFTGTVGNFDIAAGSTGIFNVGTTLTIDGTINVAGAATIRNLQTGITFIDGNGATINVQNGGSLTQLYSVGFRNIGGTSQFNVQKGGTFTKNFAGDTTIDWQMSNQGTVRAQTGILRIGPAAGFTSTSSALVGDPAATLQADAGATLDLLSSAGTGIHQLGDNVVLTGGGTFAYSGTNTNLQITGTGTGTTLAAGAAFAPGAKTIGGAGKLTNLGTLTLNSTGIMGSLENGNGGILNVNGSTDSQIDLGLTLLTGSTTNINNNPGLFNVNTALNWQAGTIAGTGGQITIGAGGNFNVTTAAAHDINAGIAIENPTGTTTVASGATLTRNAGTLTPGVFNNNGTFHVTNGIQEFESGGTSSSTSAFTADTGTTIRFNGGTYNVGAGTRLNGPGDYDVTAAGTVDLNGVPAPTTNIGTFTSAGILKLTNSTLSGNMQNSGSIDILSGVNSLTGNFTMLAGSALDVVGGATLSTAAASTFDWQQGALLSTGGGGGIFNVGGPFTVSGPGPHVVDGPTLNVAGPTTLAGGQTLQLTNGAVNFGVGGGNYNGTITVDTGKIVTFTGGLHVFRGGATTLSGAGTIVNDGATLSVEAATLADGNFFTQASGTFNIAAGQTFTKNNGIFNFTGGQVNGNATGAITMTNLGTFRTANAGTKTLDNMTLNALNIHAAGGTLVSQNNAIVNATSAVTIDAGATIQIDGGTFAPTAAFNDAGIFTLNAGNVNLPLGGTQTGVFNVAAGAGLDFTGGTHVINGAQLNGAGDYVHSGGVFNVTGSSAANGAQFDHSGGSFLFAGGATFTKDSGAFDWIASGINGPGTLMMTNGAVLNVSGGTPKFLNGPTINALVLNLNSGILGVQNGALNVSGATTIAGPASLQITGGTFSPAAAFSSAGTFTVNAGTVNLPGGGTQSGTFNVGAAGTLDFTGGTHTLNGAQFNGAGTYVNSAGMLDVVGPTAANGALFFQTGGTLNVGAGQTFTKNTGILHWMGGQFSGPGTIALTGGATLNLSGNGAKMFNGPTLTAGSLDLTDGSFTLQSGSFTSSGPVSVGAGTSLQVLGGTFNTQGTFDVSGSLLNNATINNTNPITLAAGTLGGIGTFNGSIVNNGGMVMPGQSPGTMTINGDYTQGPGGTLAIELGGTQQGVSYDLMRVTGTANLGGTLDVRHSGTHTPQTGETYAFMTYANRNGDFTSFVYPSNFAYTAAAGAASYVISLEGSSLNPNATNDVLALKENENMIDEAFMRVEDDDKRKLKGAVCR